MENKTQVENASPNFYIGEDVKRDKITNMPLIKKEKNQSPEIYPSFWVTPRTKDAGNFLLVKRFSNGNEDNVHIMRINHKQSGSRFKFPSFFMSILISRMESIIKRLHLNNDQRWALNGLSTSTAWNELSSDVFWNGPEALKILRFHFCPYISEYGTLTFRLWNEVDKAHQKSYETDDGTMLWRGPAVSIGVAALKGLLKALKELISEKPETY